MSTLRVTVVQFAPGESAAANLEAMAPFVQEAAEAGSEMVVFPEYSHAFTPTLGDQWAAAAESAEGEFVRGLTALSTGHGGMVIVAGMLLRSLGDERPANTQVAVGPEGILARAEKIHLYDAFGATESTWIRPGALS
ncbi:MAG: hydrolase, partial [Pontimonas sp.]|nr:hydrolase [Pontimonas sp.]